MRDAERLNKFYDRLKELHKKYCPDWRFGQLMVNLADEMGDPFYWEEDKFLEILEGYLKKTFELHEEEKKMLDAMETIGQACQNFYDCDGCPIHKIFEEADDRCYVQDFQDYVNNYKLGAK